jgi:pre-mRNA-splicing factor CDC5/CEF1
MAPTYIKGGVWTNVEDEVLRAAISKYGLTQWSRVSSLLARKTAKQCKARWVEWLDPSVKKIEWSREEDEKLLHLAKIMPTQWRTIAPIVGRTATQCLERYQKLLDDAERVEGLNLTGTDEASGEAVRRLRAGDIDPTPETKPAKPDEIDMDEDEKEMLSEARARLANTQGKKAKRKDRERLLQESKRLTLLQKRRQLKQAGINIKLHKKGKGIDYNADIPLQHKPAPGFYDTTEEKGANLNQKLKFDRMMQSKGMYHKDSIKGEEKTEKKRDRDDNAIQLAAAARAEAKLRELNQADQVSKRRRLMLPPPQVRDDELEQIIKHTRRGDQMKASYADEYSAASGLSGEYDTAATPLPMRTPQGEDKVLYATQELRDLTNSRSSLLGDETPSVVSTSTRHTAMETPNVVLTRTQRDAFGVNAVDVGATPREVIRQGFISLPKPKNDFEIALPEDDEQVENDQETDHLVEDAGERERKMAAHIEQEKQKALLRRTMAVQKGLPIPDVNKIPIADGSIVEQQIAEEMHKLIDLDRINPNATSVASDDIRRVVEGAIDEELGQIDPEEATTEQEDLPEDASQLIQSLAKMAENCNKQEEKLGLVLGGYVKRQTLLITKLKEGFEALVSTQIEREIYEDLAEMEAVAISSRLGALQDEVNFLADSERRHQQRYRDLLDITNGVPANNVSEANERR